ncbi:hypothetical protein FN846DRAFT_887406 [Sphaerosporella brunnea]|uniref:Uncharacterized protein n=1 Tax=Sphaerosporella brunnea TaxID=1250544 RepID=A0A5J5F6D4_9PEZI|nr:hypothetical protein FN846DRAFT_887406 [Sphaerosporella brunnea]
MPPKLSLKRIFDEAGLDKQTGIILPQRVMRVCRQNSWHNKTGFWRDAIFKETERPALLRTIANKIGLYEIYPELYTRPLDERRLYRFVEACFDMASGAVKVPGTVNYLRLQLFRRTSYSPWIGKREPLSLTGRHHHLRRRRLRLVPPSAG